MDSITDREKKFIGLNDLVRMAKKYGFNNVFDFSIWVENNNLAEALGFEEDIQENEFDNVIENIIEDSKEKEDKEIIEEKEDKESLKYKAKVHALDILSLPEVKKELKNLESEKKSISEITLDKWLEWSRKVKESKR